MFKVGDKVERKIGFGGGTDVGFVGTITKVEVIDDGSFRYWFGPLVQGCHWDHTPNGWVLVKEKEPEMKTFTYIRVAKNGFRVRVTRKFPDQITLLRCLNNWNSAAHGDGSKFYTEQDKNFAHPQLDPFINEEVL